MNPEYQLADPCAVKIAPRICGYKDCTQKLAELNRGTMCFRHQEMMQARVQRRFAGFEPGDPKSGPLFVVKSHYRIKINTTGEERKRPCIVKDCPYATRAKIGRCWRHQGIPVGTPLRDGGYWRAQTATAAGIAALKFLTPEHRECAVAGCSNWLRFNNHCGFCNTHHYVHMGTPLKDGTYYRTGEKRRECAIAGCSNSLNAQNTSGRCHLHKRLRRGMEMKDGSVWIGKWERKRSAKLNPELVATAQKQRRA